MGRSRSGAPIEVAVAAVTLQKAQNIQLIIRQHLRKVTVVILPLVTVAVVVAAEKLRKARLNVFRISTKESLIQRQEYQEID